MSDIVDTNTTLADKDPLGHDWKLVPPVSLYDNYYQCEACKVGVTVPIYSDVFKVHHSSCPAKVKVQDVKKSTTFESWLMEEFDGDIPTPAVIEKMRKAWDAGVNASLSSTRVVRVAGIGTSNSVKDSKTMRSINKSYIEVLSEVKLSVGDTLLLHRS